MKSRGKAITTQTWGMTFPYVTSQQRHDMISCLAVFLREALGQAATAQLEPILAAVSRA